MLILGGLLALRGLHMALDLADHGQAVDGMGAAGAPHRAQILQLLFLQPLLFGGFLFIFRHVGSSSGCFFQCSRGSKQYAAAKISLL